MVSGPSRCATSDHADDDGSQPVQLGSPAMGAWSHGAFDNDSAADWAGELDDAEPGDRPGLVQEALLAAVEAEDYLDGDDGSIAIAAAAVVAAVTPGGPPLDHNYGPDAATIEGLALGPELVPLALAALHRVFGEDS